MWLILNERETVDLGYNVMKETEYFVSLWPRSIISRLTVRK